MIWLEDNIVPPCVALVFVGVVVGVAVGVGVGVGVGVQEIMADAVLGAWSAIRVDLTLNGCHPVGSCQWMNNRPIGWMDDWMNGRMDEKTNVGVMLVLVGGYLNLVFRLIRPFSIYDFEARMADRQDLNNAIAVRGSLTLKCKHVKCNFVYILHFNWLVVFSIFFCDGNFIVRCHGIISTPSKHRHD